MNNKTEQLRKDAVAALRSCNFQPYWPDEQEAFVDAVIRAGAARALQELKEAALEELGDDQE